MTIKIFEIFYNMGVFDRYTNFANLIKKLSAPETNPLGFIGQNSKEKRSILSSRRSNISNLTSSMCFEPDYNYNFKQRTFQNKNEENYSNDHITFETEESCMECHGLLNLEALSYDFTKMRKEIFWALCPHCSTYVMPKLGVKIGNDEKLEDEKLNNKKDIYEKVILYSPFYLHQNYLSSLLKDYGLKADVQNLRKKFTALFWNSIWYFHLMQLPFDFMIPYKECIGRRYSKYYFNNQITNESIITIIPHIKQLNFNFNNGLLNNRFYISFEIFFCFCLDCV